ncbi:CTND1 protein, partial [Polyodon spathula]|nr:CTND1 protein [Polyodon spathula]
MEDSDVDCTASLLASVREQEMQFERLTRALEEERRGTQRGTLTRAQQSQPCTVPESSLLVSACQPQQYSTLTRMLDPGHFVEETVTMEEDPDLPASVVSVETSDDGTTRRTETTVKKVVKTVTTRTVIPSVSDALSLDGSIQGGNGFSGGSMQGGGGPGNGGGYTATLERMYRGGGTPTPAPPGGNMYMGPPGTATVPRNYHYADSAGGYPRGGGGYGETNSYRPGPPSEAYASLSRMQHMDERYRPAEGYRTLDAGYRAPSRQADPYAAQPQVRMGSNLELSRGGHPERFVHEPYGLEDDQRSLGYEDLDYGLAPGLGGSRDYPSMTLRSTGGTLDPRRRLRSYEDTLDNDMGGGDPYYWSSNAPLAQAERGSMASLDGTLRKGGAPQNWRQPELPEVIAMLNYRLDPVKSNAAAFLQHLTFQNDKMKSDVRRLKGIPALVGLLDHPKKDVHYSACGALKNISFGREGDNKVAIKNCDGVPALVRLLRKARDQDLTDCITGTLWNLSSHDSVKMEIVDHALHALSDEVMVPRSGWEREQNEDSKPRHIEWETALTNTAGCLRDLSNINCVHDPSLSLPLSSFSHCLSQMKSDVRRLKGIPALVGLLDHPKKDVHYSACGALKNISFGREGDNKVAIKNCDGVPALVRLLRKARDQDLTDCITGKSNTEDYSTEVIDIPKRSAPAKGYELLFQPEVVRLYTSLLKESKNPAVLEAAAGALQNLCAGRWTYGRYIRAMVRQEKGLSSIAELLEHPQDRVVRGVSGALRNLAIDGRNRELIGKHAMANLVRNLPGGQQQPAKNLSEETTVCLLSTMNEVLLNNLEAAKKLREAQGIEKLVLINKDGNRTDKEVRGAGLVLQTVWGYKELRKPLEKEGWKKTDFMVNLNPAPRSQGYEDSTLPLMDRRAGEKGDRDMIPMNDLGPEAYSTLDQRDRN